MSLEIFVTQTQKNIMATTVQPQAGQPAYLPSGAAPPATAAMQLTSGTVMYYPPGTAGVPQGAVLMVRHTIDGHTHTCIVVTVIIIHTHTALTLRKRQTHDVYIYRDVGIKNF